MVQDLIDQMLVIMKVVKLCLANDIFGTCSGLRVAQASLVLEA